MFAYRVTDSGIDKATNTQYLWIHPEPLTYETREQNIALLREDYKFVVYLDKVYRVCQVELEDVDDRFIKFWVDDPFVGFPDYEPITPPEAPLLSLDQASDVWDVLKTIGAPEDGRLGFITTQMAGCIEYRFGGTLGFGGKFWNYGGKWYVNCYPEDETEERLATISAVNKKLAKLKKSAGVAEPR